MSRLSTVLVGEHADELDVLNSCLKRTVEACRDLSSHVIDGCHGSAVRSRVEITKVKRVVVKLVELAVFLFAFFLLGSDGSLDGLDLCLDGSSNDKDLPDSNTKGSCANDSNHNVHPDVVVAIVGSSRSSASEVSLHSGQLHDGTETELVQVNRVLEVPGIG